MDETDVIINPPSKYGYTLNVNNPVIKQLYHAYIRRCGILPPPSDRERLDFERRLKRILVKEYKAMYHYDLISPVIGWQLEQLKECVRLLDVEGTKKDLCR